MISSKSTIAVRVPNHPVPIGLINGIGAPITGTSANRSGQPTPFASEQIIQSLGTDVDYVIPGACPENNVGSTIIDISIKEAAIIRAGSIPVQQLTDIMQATRDNSEHE